MFNGLVSALLVLAGGTCAVAGYVLGSWHQRRAIEAEINGELFSERGGVDLLDDPSPPRDQRPN
jgi:hypothetical protein